MDELILWIYIAAWGGVAWLYWRKRRHFDTGFFIVLLYFVISIISYFAYLVEWDEVLKDFSLFPFFYLFFVTLFSLFPILRFDDRKVKRCVVPNRTLLGLLVWTCIIPNIISFPSTIKGLSEGLSQMMIDVAIGGELYDENRGLAETTGHGISNLPSVISTAFSGITCMLTFYYASLKKKSRLILYLLFLSCIKLALQTVSQGQRGGVVEYLLLMVVSYFLVKRFMSNTLRKTIARTGLIFVVFAFAILTAITIGRFGQMADRTFDSTVYYAGQQNLYFNKFAFDNNGIRYGDRTIPLLKRMVGIEGVPHNYIERRNKYHNLKINDEVFIGFVGDFALDFGPFLGALLLVMQTLFVLHNTKVRKGKLYLHQIILLHFTLYMVSIGSIKLYPFSDVRGNLQILVYLFLYIIFYSDYYRKVNNKQIKKENGLSTIYSNNSSKG